MLASLAHFVTAALLGGMLFFALGFAPLVFMKLPAEQAGRFIRTVFPVYYTFSAAFAALATALAFMAGAVVQGLILLVVLIGFLVARFALMPAINRLRDRGLAGDAAADHRFARLHRIGVVLNGLQMVALVAVLGLALAV